MPLLVLRTTFPPKEGTETLLHLTTYLKLAMLYELCSAPSLRTTHYALLFSAFGPPQRGYAFYGFSNIVFFPLELPPLPSAPPPMGRYDTTAYLKLAALYDLRAAPPLLITHYSLPFCDAI